MSVLTLLGNPIVHSLVWLPKQVVVQSCHDQVQISAIIMSPFVLSLAWCLNKIVVWWKSSRTLSATNAILTIWSRSQTPYPAKWQDDLWTNQFKKVTFISSRWTRKLKLLTLLRVCLVSYIIASEECQSHNYQKLDGNQMDSPFYTISSY